MKKLAEYELHAAECREMAARTSTPSHRQQLINMAETWDQLAETRRRKLLRLGKAEDDGIDLTC